MSVVIAFLLCFSSRPTPESPAAARDGNPAKARRPNGAVVESEGGAGALGCCSGINNYRKQRQQPAMTDIEAAKGCNTGSVTSTGLFCPFCLRLSCFLPPSLCPSARLALSVSIFVIYLFASSFSMIFAYCFCWKGKRGQNQPFLYYLTYLFFFVLAKFAFQFFLDTKKEKNRARQLLYFPPLLVIFILIKAQKRMTFFFS